jgi:hypothetical protein
MLLASQYKLLTLLANLNCEFYVVHCAYFCTVKIDQQICTLFTMIYLYQCHRNMCRCRTEPVTFNVP